MIEIIKNRYGTVVRAEVTEEGNHEILPFKKADGRMETDMSKILNDQLCYRAWDDQVWLKTSRRIPQTITKFIRENDVCTAGYLLTMKVRNHGTNCRRMYDYIFFGSQAQVVDLIDTLSRASRRNATYAEEAYNAFMDGNTFAVSDPEFDREGRGYIITRSYEVVPLDEGDQQLYAGYLNSLGCDVPRRPRDYGWEAVCMSTTELIEALAL